MSGEARPEEDGGLEDTRDTLEEARDPRDEGGGEDRSGSLVVKSLGARLACGGRGGRGELLQQRSGGGEEATPQQTSLSVNRQLSIYCRLIGSH